jgi:hypothetical protein
MQGGVLVGLERQDLRDLDEQELNDRLSEGPDLKRHVVAVSDTQLSVPSDLQGSRTMPAGVMCVFRFELVKDMLEAGEVRLT